jgi:hypothetical protein
MLIATIDAAVFLILAAKATIDQVTTSTLATGDRHRFASQSPLFRAHWSLCRLNDATKVNELAVYSRTHTAQMGLVSKQKHGEHNLANFLRTRTDL